MHIFCIFKGGLLILVKRRGKKGATLDASSIGGPLKTSKSLARCALFAAATTLAGIAAAQTLVLESPPAKVTGERHKGVFAEGAALSLGEKLQPLDPSPVKTVRLDYHGGLRYPHLERTPGNADLLATIAARRVK